MNDWWKLIRGTQTADTMAQNATDLANWSTSYDQRSYPTQLDELHKLVENYMPKAVMKTLTIPCHPTEASKGHTIKITSPEEEVPIKIPCNKPDSGFHKVEEPNMLTSWQPCLWQKEE